MFNSDCCSVISNRRASCQTLIHSRLVRHPIRGLPICEPASRSYPHQHQHQHQSPEASCCFVLRQNFQNHSHRQSRFTAVPVSTGRSKIEDFPDHERLCLSDDVDLEQFISKSDGAWCLTACVMGLSARHADHHYLIINRAHIMGQLEMSASHSRGSRLDNLYSMFEAMLSAVNILSQFSKSLS